MPETNGGQPDRLPLDFLEATYPWIPWRDPLRASLVEGAVARLACRVCIANVGLHGYEITDLPATEEEFERHFRRHLGLRAVV